MGSTAIVVGSGPNGLTCAAILARAGVEVTVIEAADTPGGGARSSELTRPGLLHDHCSATHPMACASPALRELDLAAQGLEWLWPEIELAHPLPDGGAALLHRSVDETAAELGPDEATWRRLFARPAAGFEQLNRDLVEPILHLPRHPLRLARFGLAAALPATLLARRFREEAARALFGGVAAHSYSSLNRPLSSAVGAALIVAGHSVGWPVAKGGSQAITDALVAVIVAAGGRIETGRPLRDLGELPAADAVIFDLAPGAIAELAGSRLSSSVRRALRRYRHGPGAFKLDLAVEGDLPWLDPRCGQAGTVHVIGSFAELVHAEAEINRGRMPERPFLLVGQQYRADPGRSAGGLNPIWAYAHVPAGYRGDATEAILAQIERFAPGTRERIVEIASRDPAGFADYNANYVGGDILTGANSPLQMIFRPRITTRPYRLGGPGLYICSAATPPGAGIHGMGGYNAAQEVLRRL